MKYSKPKSFAQNNNQSDNKSVYDSKFINRCETGAYSLFASKNFAKSISQPSLFF